MEAVDIFARQLQRYPVLAKDRELEVAARMRDPALPIAEQKRARDLLINSNLRFALKNAHKFADFYRQPLEDMLQAANEGMVHAARLFDYQRGWRFITFATHWMRAKMTMTAIQNHSLVRYGTTTQQKALFSKARFLYGEIKTKFPELEDDEIFQRLGAVVGISGAKAADIYQRVTNVDVSLQTPILHRSTGTQANLLTLQDLLADDRPPIDELCERAELLTEIKRIALSLARTRREHAIVTQRWFTQDEPWTLLHLAERVIPKVSRERVRQIEVALLARVKAAL